MFFQYREEIVIKEKYEEYKTSQDDLDTYKNTGDFYKSEDKSSYDDLSDEDLKLFNDMDINEITEDKNGGQ